MFASKLTSSDTLSFVVYFWSIFSMVLLDEHASKIRLENGNGRPNINENKRPIAVVYPG